MQAQATTFPEREEQALARAVVYRLLAGLFRAPAALLQGGGEGSLDARSALDCLREGPAICGREVLEALAACLALAEDRERLESDQARVMGHTPRAGAVPYETEWAGAAGDLLQFHQLGDLAGFYRAFGLEPGTHCHERPDHVSVELAFLHFLCVKEAWAAGQADARLADVSRQAQERFLSEHLGSWAPAFCVRLARLDPDGFHGRASCALEGWLGAEAARLGATLGEATLEPGESSIRLEDCCVSCAGGPCALDGARGAGYDPPAAG